jgi:hypothetical protein
VALFRMMRFFPPIRHGLIAPSRTDLAGSGTTRSPLNAILRPRPPQAAQAPSWWLKEKCRGTSRSYTRPQTAQLRL